MQIRWNPISAVSKYEERVTKGLKELEVIIGGYSYGWHHDFIAVVVAFKEDGCLNEMSYDRFYKESVMCEAWLGNEESIRQAQRDYLANACHKTFTSVRTGLDNSDVLLRHQELLVAADSRWPGAVVSGDIAIGCSGLLPPEDMWCSDWLLSFVRETRLPRFARRLIAQANDPLRAIYPRDGSDLIGGISLNQPPELWW